MSPQVWLTVVTLIVGALNAWQSANIRNAILGLNLQLSERIARAEGDIKAMQALEAAAQCPAVLAFQERRGKAIKADQSRAR
jgi:hypothetical protein